MGLSILKDVAYRPERQLPVQSNQSFHAQGLQIEELNLQCAEEIRRYFAEQNRRYQELNLQYAEQNRQFAALHNLFQRVFPRHDVNRASPT